jgi:hypothetical protein
MTPNKLWEFDFLCSSLVMSPGGGSLSESLDAFGLPIPDGGGSTSTSVDWHPFNVSLIASKERKMRANSGDGGGHTDVGGPCDDVPRPRFPRVLTILNIESASKPNVY